MENKEKIEEDALLSQSSATEKEDVEEAKKLEEVKGEKEKEKEREEKEKGIVSQYVDMRMLALLAVGVLLGFVIKTQTTETIVMGANDYKLEKTRSEYLLTDIQKQKQIEEEARLKELESEEIEGIQAEKMGDEMGEGEQEEEEFEETEE